MTNRIITVCSALLVLLGATAAWAAAPTPAPANPHWPQKWNYGNMSVRSDADVVKAIDWLKLSADAGCTHVAFGCGGMGTPSEMADADYIKRAAKVRAAAEQMHLVLVPSIFSVGYGGETLRVDGNLLAGLPVKDMPFIIKGKIGEPDPSVVMEIKDPGFEDFDGKQLAGWDAIAPNMAVDTGSKHSGKQSLKINVTGKDKGDWEDDEMVIRPAATTLNQSIEVKPFQYYKLSCWVKAQDYKVNSNLFTVAGINADNAQRKLTQWHTPLSAEQQTAADWTQIAVYFNTVDSTKVLVQVGTRGGHVGGVLWVDDIKVEPAGFMLALHRPTLPCVVTSEDGKTVYSEGKDYKPVIDSAVAAFGHIGELDVTHEPPKLELTDNSAIKDGQKVLASFYNTTRINDDQDVVTMQDPRILARFDEIMQGLAKAWPTKGYFLGGYDEIRICGWEPNPGGEKLTPGQILGRHVTASHDIVKKYMPDAVVYTWEDMFSPYHNARTKGVYFLCNGNYGNAWEGLPKDMVIMNWDVSQPEALTFFSDKGFHQIISGYYDSKDTAGLKEGIKNFMTKAAGVPNIDGVMYTTWSANYKFLKEYFQLLDSYPAWN